MTPIYAATSSVLIKLGRELVYRPDVGVNANVSAPPVIDKDEVLGVEHRDHDQPRHSRARDHHGRHRAAVSRPARPTGLGDGHPPRAGDGAGKASGSSLTARR
ncbi:MAG: hypothetical protein WDO24_23660 [Pseudomonadota bacterium]